MSQQNSKFYTRVRVDSVPESDIDDDIEYENKYNKTRKSKGLLSLMINPWFILFAFCLHGSILFIPFWFYNNDIVFYICGGLTLLMLILAVYIFYTFGGTKSIMSAYKNLNRNLQIQNRKLKAQIDRTCKAIEILRDAKKRIMKINVKNRNNSKLFEQIEIQMNTAGIKQDTNNRASILHDEWQTEYIKNEKETLHKIYTRFIAQKSGDNNYILETINREQFDEFQYNVLPIIYRAKLAKLDVFDELDPHGDGVIYVKEFEKYLDKIAENIDIEKDIEQEFEDIDSEFEQKLNANDSDISKSKSNKHSKPPKRKEIVPNNSSSGQPVKASKPPKGKKSLFADDYKIEIESKNDSVSTNASRPIQRNKSPFVSEDDTPQINIETEPTPKGKDYDTLDEKEKQKQKRKIGKLKVIWGDTPTVSMGRYSPTNKVINPDESWVKHKSAKTIHPVHESVDALMVKTLVSQANMFTGSPIAEEKEKDDDDFKQSKRKIGKVKLPKAKSYPLKNEAMAVKRKGSVPDESWIKHKAAKIDHGKHQSVEALQLKSLVSGADIMRQLSTVGENEEDTPMRGNEEENDDAFDIQ